MTDLLEQVADLLLKTGKDHHAAFIEVDGADPDWPLWYAERLETELPSLLGRDYTRSELTWLMIDLDRHYRRVQPTVPWHTYYAMKLMQDYPDSESSGVYESISAADLPSLTAAQMAEVDRLMVDEYGISLVQMMENAGRALARLARDLFLEGNPRGKNVVVLAGTGGNGGGAMVAARHLANQGAAVHVLIAREPTHFKQVPSQQLAILQRMRLPIHPDAQDLPEDLEIDLILDGLIGYNLEGAPQGTTAILINWANTHNTPILALDVPSGLDSSTGQLLEPTVKASATLSLALPKTGLLRNSSARAAGKIYLADIGIPPQLYARPGLELDVRPIFAHGEIVQLI